jgi:hypothetical protein
MGSAGGAVSHVADGFEHTRRAGTRQPPPRPLGGPPRQAQDWRLPHERRVHAARVARRLQPAARLAGGYASSRLRVLLPRERERRPVAALAVGDPPVDGITRTAPLLVVEFAPGRPGWWIAAGSEVVWVITEHWLVVYRADLVPLTLAPDDCVMVPRAERLSLPVRELLFPALRPRPGR